MLSKLADDGYVNIVFIRTWNEYPMYIVYSDGRIFSKFINGFLNPTKTPDGYYTITLYRQGEKKGLSMRVNRLVAFMFIPNPKNKSDVNHKDSNKLNNDISNLEWVTRKEHARHTADSGNVKYHTVPVYQFSLDRKFIRKFNSTIEAADFMGISPNLITAAMNSKTLKSRNYYWSKEKSLKMLDNGRCKPVEKVSKKTGKVIQWYPSVREANRQNGIPEKNVKIGRACNNKKQPAEAFGFYWRFAEKPAKEKKFTEWKKWKSPPNFSQYRISRDGRIWSMKYEKLLKPTLNGKYKQIRLYNDDGDRPGVKVQRLIKLTYDPIDNPKEKVVNHIDENPLNNDEENLEWTTQKKNVEHSAYKNKTTNKRKGHKRHTPNGTEKRVGQYIKGTDTLIKEYKSAADAARNMGVSVSCISATARGDQPSSCGYDWWYLE